MAKFEAELGLNTKEYDDKLKKADQGMSGFAKQLGTAAAAAAVAAAAFKIMIDWMKQTEWGAALMNKGLAVTKQLLQDIMAHQESNLKEAARIADAKSAEIAGETKDQYEAAKMQSELNLLLIEAVDHTKTLAEKKETLNKAMEKEKELKSFLLNEAKKDLQNAADFWRINLGNIAAKNAYYVAAKKVAEIEGMGSWRTMSQFTGVLEQQAERARDLVDAFTPVVKSLEDIKKAYENIPWAKTSQLSGLPQNNVVKSVFEKKTYGIAAPISNVLAGAPKGFMNQAEANAMAEKVQSVTDELSDQQKAVLQLSDTFAGFFSDVNLGFQGMIDGVITGIRRLVMELIAKAAFLAILSAITGVPLMPLLKTALPGGMGKLMEGSAGSAGFDIGSTVGTQTIQVVGTIKGKDIALANRRYYNG